MEPPARRDETTRLTRPDPGGPGRFRLVIVTDEAQGARTLPESGAVVIGRGTEAGVRIDDPSLSREHARLHLGWPIRIEDLGSANGTRVRGQALAMGTAVELAPGEVAQLGEVALFLQRVVAHERPRRLWGHGFFETRLEEECARTGRKGRLALLRIRVEGAAAPAVVQEALHAATEPMDVIAVYGPGQYEVLLPDADAERAADVAGQLSVRLRGKAQLRIGAATLPVDGRTPELLGACVEQRLRGGTETKTPGAGSPVVLDEAMRHLYELATRVAASQLGVLILGETGSGKEVLAEFLHEKSPRAGKPFVRLNCGALSETLLESELFGHEKGAFTGAVAAKAGLVEAAAGGTLFLDEVGELAAATQVKLLRVLEDRAVLRVGAVKPRAVDLRIIAATNRDLESEVAAGAFRQDLYFRLNGVVLAVPPLRERPSEVEALARSFASAASRREKRLPEVSVSAAALSHLRAYCWPGNVRELRNMIERAVVLCEGREILAEHLPLDRMASTLLAPPASLPAAQAPATEAGSEADERARIVEALAACAGNQTRAAEMLGISRRTLVTRLGQLRLPRPKKRSG